MYYGCKLPSAYSPGESTFFGDHEEQLTVEKQTVSDLPGQV